MLLLQHQECHARSSDEERRRCCVIFCCPRSAPGQRAWGPDAHEKESRYPIDCGTARVAVMAASSVDTSSVYQTPDWAKAPQNDANWTLMEVKNGVELATHALDKSCTTFGRSTDDCDIPLLHGSISRLHARIAFDSTGAPWLKDLESTHGVTVNKKRLPPSSISRRESNSTMAGARGVRVFPGDILQFGASTRIYCLQGPAEHERGRTTGATKDAKLTVPEAVALLTETTSSNDDGRHNCTSPLGDHNETLRDDIVPPSHRRQWEQLLARRYKLENLERESDRINAKANVQDLSEGQERQLEKNQSNIDQIKMKVDALEQELKKAIFGSSQALGTRRNRPGHEEIEDEDVVDRTRDFSDDGQSDEPDQAMTEEAMSSAWVALCREYQSVVAKVASVSRAATTLQTKITAASEDDVFFLQNELDLNQDNLTRLKQKACGIESKIEEMERLLHLINDKVSFEREKCRILHASDRITKSDDAASPAPKSAPTFHFFAPKPILAKRPDIQRHHDVNPASRADQTELDCTRLPPPRPPPTKRPKVAVAMEQPVRPYLAPPAPKAPPQDKASNSASSQEKHDRWQAPNDQDGSGRTKLNDKFKGRY
jgi:pSer/pThr/pTyr-binding forkhead associated (FHA) protein